MWRFKLPFAYHQAPAVVVASLADYRLLQVIGAYMNLKRFFSRGHLQCSTSQRQSLSRISHLLQSVDVVVDAGAHKGLWTRHMHDLALDAHWLLFEPQTQYWQEIERNVGTLGIKYSLENRLLFHTSDVERTFYVVQDADCLTGSSIYPEKGRELAKSKLKTISIDDCFAAHRLGGASAFMKMDIQGAELDCLQGADQALSETLGVLCEVNILDYNQGSPSYSDLDVYMVSKGFRLADIAGSARLKDGRLNQLDLLYLPAKSPMMSI